MQLKCSMIAQLATYSMININLSKCSNLILIKFCFNIQLLLKIFVKCGKIVVWQKGVQDGLILDD